MDLFVAPRDRGFASVQERYPSVQKNLDEGKKKQLKADVDGSQQSYGGILKQTYPINQMEIPVPGLGTGGKIPS